MRHSDRLCPAGVSSGLIAAAQRLSGAVGEERNGILADRAGNAVDRDLTSPLLSHAIEAVEEEPAVCLPRQGLTSQGGVQI